MDKPSLNIGGIVGGTILARMVDGEVIIPLSQTNKFVLAFDEVPDLIFVQEKGKRGRAKVYQDGVELQGVKAIDIRASVDDMTTHTVEYITGCTRPERPPD